MIYEVEMHAFGKGAIRKVTVPDSEIALDRSIASTVQRVFELGQNDVCSAEDRAQGLPSVSVGDIVRIARRYVVMPLGFKEVSADFMPPAGDRAGMYAYRFIGGDEGAAGR